MAERVIERTETETPRETVVVHDRDRDAAPERSNTGIIIAVIILVIVILLLIFGRGLIGGGGGGGSSPTVHVTAPSTSGQ